MAIYDTRFLGSNARPLLTFPSHRNEAHFHIGFDASPQLNVVAAAQENGTVKLFSLSTGRQLRCRALDAVRTAAPIKALMFQRMPRENMESIWVGEGCLVKKFSFGTENWEDEA